MALASFVQLDVHRVRRLEPVAVHAVQDTIPLELAAILVKITATHVTPQELIVLRVLPTFTYQEVTVTHVLIAALRVLITTPAPLVKPATSSIPTLDAPAALKTAIRVQMPLAAIHALPAFST